MFKNTLGKTLLAFALFIFASSAFAIPKEPCDTKEVCCEDPAPGPFAFSYPKDVGLSCPRDFYIHGEFMWMKATEEGLEYAIDQDSSTAYTFPLTTGIMAGGFSAGSQEWDWRPGFRVGFGFYSNYDNWNFDVNMTYFRMKADSEASNSGTGVLLPMYLPPQGRATNILTSSSRWSGDFSTLDLMLGKPYHVSRYFTSTPMFGIRAAWIDQNYLIRYFIHQDDLKNTVFLKNDYWGVGLRGSYEGNFLLGSGWFIYGKAAFSLLYGKFDTSQNSEYQGSNIAEYKLEDSFYSVQPNTEIGIGLSWGKYMNKGQYLVSVKVGYEFHQWWDQFQARRFFDADPTANDTVSRGDLSFNGFLFGLSIDF